MKYSMIALTLALVAIVSQAAVPAKREKRFAGFGAFSTVGGRVGCVVSENGPGNASLFVNSHFTKFLSEEEMQELEQYKQDLAQFKTEVKSFLEQRQKQALSQQRRPSVFPGRQAPQQFPGLNSNGAMESSADEANRTQQPGSNGNGKQPEPPKKPSFCSEKATTQYVFDGCSVQGDNVFIGDNFVRKLTPSEQDELAQFDKQFTAYQKAVTNNFKQQVEEIFGKHFGSLFENGASSSKSQESNSSTNEPSNDSTSTAATPAEAPKTPNFCTLIV